jgi:hypothetical protein
VRHNNRNDKIKTSYFWLMFSRYRISFRDLSFDNFIKLRARTNTATRWGMILKFLLPILRGAFDENI